MTEQNSNYDREIDIYNRTFDVDLDEDIKLFNGDCFDKINAIDEKSIDLVLTDPPYWHKKSPGKPYSERTQSNTSSRFANSILYNQDCEMMKKMSDFTNIEIWSFLDEIKRVMKIMNAYIFCNETQLPYYCMWSEKNKLMFSVLVWEKPLSIINKNRFSQNTEYIVRIYDYGTALRKSNPSDFYGRVFHDKPVRDKSHPTEKPLSICEKIIKLSSNIGDVILDPFMGSGTTGVAAIKNKRKFIGMEIDESFFFIAKRKIEERTCQLSLF